MEWCLKAKWLPPAVITAQESWNERDKVWGRGEVLISLSRLQRLLQFNPYVSVTDAAKTITEVGRGAPAPSELLPLVAGPCYSSVAHHAGGHCCSRCNEVQQALTSVLPSDDEDARSGRPSVPAMTTWAGEAAAVAPWAESCPWDRAPAGWAGLEMHQNLKKRREGPWEEAMQAGQG